MPIIAPCCAIRFISNLKGARRAGGGESLWLVLIGFVGSVFWIHNGLPNCGQRTRTLS
ncbi:MAG TPA: hypothetical protein VNO52_18550 [Methylomirabilota bacterium]|nr:hypothetical protein [Methylomirabilota bacterium]